MSEPRSSRLEKVVVAVLTPPALALLAFNWVCEETTGWGRWRRRHVRRMTERDPLSDADFLAAVGATPDDAQAWLAARDGFAHHAGLPATVIRPDDEAGLLFLLIEPWAGLLDIMFFVERRCGVKIDRGAVEDRLLAAGVALETAPFTAFAAELAHEVARSRG